MRQKAIWSFLGVLCVTNICSFEKIAEKIRINCSRIDDRTDQSKARLRRRFMGGAIDMILTFSPIEQGEGGCKSNLTVLGLN